MKIKSTLTIIILIGSFNLAKSQQIDTKQLLDKINNAVNSISEAKFILHDNYNKISVGEDSTKRKSHSKCFFKKLPTDSLIGYLLASFRNDGYEQVYDGNALLSLTPWNKTLEITEKTMYPNKIKELRSNYFIFPFLKYLNAGLQFYNKDTMLNKIKVSGFELFNGEQCYKIQTGISPNTGKNKVESYIFVSTKSFLPIRNYIYFETIVGQAKEIQVFDYWISDFKPGAIDKKQFTKEVLSSYDRIAKYNPSSEDSKNQLLPIGTIAPDWKLPLLSGQKLKLSDLKGKIVIMDFWYKACAPCQKQMISLQKLHEQFDKEKIVFIGINTIDDPIKDKIELFLKNRNITLVSVFNGKTIENLYKVYASPALFIIDKEGKIVFTIDGYSTTLYEDVTKVIEQHL